MSESLTIGEVHALREAAMFRIKNTYVPGVHSPLPAIIVKLYRLIGTSEAETMASTVEQWERDRTEFWNSHTINS